MAMRLLDLFSGIGGFSYAAETLIGGYETVAFCEMDKFCQKILKKHWPQVPIFDDVRTIDAARLGDIDICTFGFPCQPVSQAGLQKAESDDRWLWDEIIRILQSCKPKWIIAENVKGLVSVEDGLLIEKCISDLEAEGYEVQPIIIPACAKNAPHRRDRVWIIGQNVDDSNDSTDRAKRGKTRKEDSLQKEYRQTGFSWFADRTSDDSEPMANTKRMGFKQRAEKSEELDRERSSDQSDNGSQGCTISNTDKDVANTKRKSINNTDSKGNIGFKKEEQETRAANGSSSGQDVPNTKSEGLQGRQFSSTISNEGNEESNIRTRDSEKKILANTSSIRQSRSRKSVEPISSEENKTRKTSGSDDGSQRGKHRGNIEQRVGDMADGISRGLLRHFDREPEHIPRVTKGEKDRAKKLKALGNSIVPQVAAEILLAIRVSEESD